MKRPVAIYAICVVTGLICLAMLQNVVEFALEPSGSGFVAFRPLFVFMISAFSSLSFGAWCVSLWIDHQKAFTMAVISTAIFGATFLAVLVFPHLIFERAYVDTFNFSFVRFAVWTAFFIGLVFLTRRYSGWRT